MYVANSSGDRKFSLVIRIERRACRFCAASLFVTWLDCLSLGSAMHVDNRFLCDGAYARCAGVTCTCVETGCGTVYVVHASRASNAVLWADTAEACWAPAVSPS